MIPISHTPKRWYRLPTSHQKTLPWCRWRHIKVASSSTRLQNRIETWWRGWNTDQPWWCQRAWGCEQQCGEPAPSGPHQGDQPAPATSHIWFAFLGIRRNVMHEMLSVQFSFTIYAVSASDCWCCYQGFAWEWGDPLEFSNVQIFKCSNVVTRVLRENGGTLSTGSYSCKSAASTSAFFLKV